MKKINLRQRQNLADFFREISVAFVSIGGFSAIFDKNLNFFQVLYQMIFSIGISIILLIISSSILNKNDK